MRRRLLTVLLAGLCACHAALLPAQTEDTVLETPEARDARMEWWREARFGMFIHWGVYSVPAGIHNGQPVDGIGEWIMDKAKIPIPEYEQYAQRFNPVGFDAEAWVKIAKNAGMKYIVITAKHHDGFCMWDSQVSTYDIVDFTPIKRDVLKELAAACQKQGIRLCFYYSIMDWHHPDARRRRFPKYRDNYMIPQLKELLGGSYGDIGVLWFDGEWIREWTEPQGKALYGMLREIKPDLIINNRVGKGRTGMLGMNREGGFAGDFGTPEQKIPAKGFAPGVDWESCMTMNDTWGYKSDDHNWKSTKTLIQQLIDIASKGGNYLLNVCPTADGLIPEPSVERLEDIGAWMAVNSESIYGTQASPFPKLDWGRCTQKKRDSGTTLYLHVFKWPKDGKLLVPGLGNEVESAMLLATNEEMKFEKTTEGVELHVPKKAIDPNASVIKLEILGEPRVTDI
jgi:alpha-L-fucosidase